MFRTELKVGRIPVTGVQPVIDCGAHPAKAVIGEDIPVRATVFREGHDRLGATAVLVDPSGAEVQRVRMTEGTPGLDEYLATVRPTSVGHHRLVVEGWSDPFATWHHAATVKIAAGIDVELMLAEGGALFRRAAADRERSEADRATLARAVRGLEDSTRDPHERLAAADDPELTALLEARPIREFVSASPAYPLDVQRALAGRGAWYEFFPRSEGAVYHPETGEWTSGTFTTAAERLPAVADMGFDVVYLPPIHPIGRSHRKGPNNALDAGPKDPGSPWAIGSPEGGHDAIHPDLGTEEDFAAFVQRAEDLGLAVALDLALQCSPDHPWVTEHPEWFTTRVDGSIAYAENPPKKYQDIYPLNFDNDPRGLRRAVLKVVELWIARGVKIFRVDNPHTKPLWFWEWLIAKVHRRHPEVVFLAEAFTRPAMMHALGRVGFQQSYSYFTWRNSRDEVAEYLHEVTAETAAFYRPNFFVNTPDILSEYLQFGGPGAFKIRAVLAATSNPLWGMYAGFELFEHVARPGAEEYIDNEKYEFRPRDFARAEAEGASLAPYITRLNQIRRAHPALQDLQNLTLHSADNGDILAFSKSRRHWPDGQHRAPAGVGTTEHDDEGPLARDMFPGVPDALGVVAGLPGHADTVIVVVNCDPHEVREATVSLNLEALDLRPQDLDPEGRFEVEDLLTGRRWHWGEHNYVRLDPHVEPAHILRVIRQE
ncbi:alpha-1,4-glucan--maltose-1-phosphate maltosyltransferase [Citricoccus sp. GCM10030269]|uniref:alpha-1,4-glucan--maltose-1-phosphate maltosyltransferase n=1 Tax=Citricoccus sp. GCM10030269 TaxID=3273388 RepID=UPI00361B2DA5